ncbi:hypothetical protein G7054_g7830 [Neopestalotiopsis clavispora]|nr:hypothetical protein G7054_g7830 [Neopestalotiopsis clavispora]
MKVMINSVLPALAILSASINGASGKCHPRPLGSTLDDSASHLIPSGSVVPSLPQNATNNPYVVSGSPSTSVVISSHFGGSPTSNLPTSSGGLSGSTNGSVTVSSSSGTALSFSSATETASESSSSSSSPEESTATSTDSSLSSMTESSDVSSSSMTEVSDVSSFSVTESSDAFISTDSTMATATGSNTVTTTESDTVTSTDSSSQTTETSTFNTADYSYYEVTLPITFTTTAESTIAATSTYSLTMSATASPSCVIDSDSVAAATLRLGDNAGNRFVPKNGGIGVLEDSDFPSAQSDATEDTDGSLAAANQAYYENLVFHLEEVADGLFDLVTEVDSITVYVGYLQSTGAVVTSASRSSGSSTDLATTVFSFSCQGRLVITSPSGEILTWKIDETDNISTKFVTGTPAGSEEILLITTTVPDSNYDSSSTQKRSRYGAMNELHRRMSPYTDGDYPRIPSSPANMYSRKRSGARDMQYNGCGSGSTAAWVPQLSFGSCCNMHDYCYDNCATQKAESCNDQYCYPGQWERCNNAFYWCMHDTVCADISWGWFPVRRALCEFEASFYTAVVSTYLGGNAFNEATSDRCGAYCSNDAPYCDGACVSPTDDNNCSDCGLGCNTAASFGCRNSKCTCVADTQNDKNNCGGCGNVCPYKTKCSGASCVCADDTCGNLCINMQTHPRNCGSCGNVCSSGYCWGGQCIDPSTLATGTASAATCLATDAVKNGGFDTVESGTSASPWTVSDVVGAVDINFGSNSLATSSPNLAAFHVTRLQTDAYVSFAGFQLNQNISLCPGASYELTFEAALTDSTMLTVYLDSVSNQLTPLVIGSGSMRGYGPYPFTVASSTDTFAYKNLMFSLAVFNNLDSILIDDVSVYQA